MQVLTTKQLDYLRSGGRLAYRLSVEPTQGAPFILTEKDIIAETFSVNRACVSGMELEIGSTVAAELSFQLYNLDGRYNSIVFEGAQVTASYIIAGETLPIGVFIVDERPEAWQVLSIRALDRLARLSRVCLDNLGGMHLNNVPAHIAAYCGVPIHTTNLPSISYALPTDFSLPKDTTYRQLLGWIAALHGANAYVNAKGAIAFTLVRPFNATMAKTITKGEYFDLLRAEKSVAITGVKYEYTTPAHNLISNIIGTNVRVLDLTGNPLIALDAEGLMARIWGFVDGLSYTPVKNLSSLAFPHIWPNDWLIVKTQDADINVLVTSNTTATLSSITSQGKTDVISGYATGAPLTTRQAAIVSHTATVEANKATSALATEVIALNEQTTNGLGFYQTVKAGENGRRIIYYHDQITLEASMYIATMTEAGQYAWTTSGWNGGSPIWQYGATKDGSLVMRLISAVGINADWVKLNGAPVKAYIDTADAREALKSVELIRAETNARVRLAELMNAKAEDLQGQIDGAITTWSLEGEPKDTTAPTVDWTDEKTKAQHLGDVYYDKLTGYAYRYQVAGGVYSWGRLTDSDVTKALKDSKDAKDLADGKRRHFVGATPKPPYDEGDQWTTPEGVLMVCVNAKQFGNYDASDFKSLLAYASRAELDAVSSKLSKDLADLANDDTITPYEMAHVKKTWQAVESEYKKIIAMLAAVDADLRPAVESEYKDAYKALEAFFMPLLANLGTYAAINGAELNKALVRYETARVNVGAVIAKINATQFATLTSGLINMGERVGVYEAQINITPNKITLSTLAGGRAVEAATVTASRLGFSVDGKEVAYFGNSMFFIADAEVTNSLRMGNHVAQTAPTGHTIFRYVGGNN